jgi:hypothetical protein
VKLAFSGFAFTQDGGAVSLLMTGKAAAEQACGLMGVAKVPFQCNLLRFRNIRKAQ